MTIEIIAEAAQGFEGDPTQARLLTRGAARAGADAVKFQLVYAAELATPDYRYYDLFRQLEMPFTVWQAVAAEAQAANLRLYFDVYGERSFREAVALGAQGIKISTTEFHNAHLVRLALQTNLRLYVSLGGIEASEVQAWLSSHQITPDHPVCFLYGFQAEPTPLAANNLRRLTAWQAAFPQYRFGFMDHSDGANPDSQTLALLALALGAQCVEKHLTLDRALQLEDYVSALAPAEFSQFAERLKYFESALGSPELVLTEAEQEYRRKAMKTVVAKQALAKGETLTVENVCLKRSGQRGAFERLEEVLGRQVCQAVEVDCPLTLELLA